jgi:hypothetical protein
VRWKPIVWREGDHYSQWHSYVTRDGTPPQQGMNLMLVEHPGRGYIAVAVEAETEPLLVWLKPVPRNAPS